MSLEESIPGVSRFCHQAMATTFEIYIFHSDVRYAEQAAYASFDELDGLEGQLSRFINGSDIWQINNLKAGQALAVGPEVFECLELCGMMYAETEGAFDITFGSAIRGYQLKLEKGRYIVQQPEKRVTIDPGGVGKGYAVDKMGQILGEWGIEVALLRGGYSSVLATGPPAGREGWPMILTRPGGRRQVLERLFLRNRAIGASGLEQRRHLVDPRTGEAVTDRCIAWAVAPTAGVADALSTAFMVMGPEQIKRYCRRSPEVSAMVVAQNGAVHRFGVWGED